MPEEQEKRIECSIFNKAEATMNDLTQRINQAMTVDQKAEHAQELLEKAKELIDCPQVDKQSRDCKNCGLISNLRKETAELILKARKLG